MNSNTIKERPILFSAPMVRAILDGRKTQTRRVLRNQPTIIRDPFPTTDDVKNVFRFKQSTGIYQCLGMQNLIDTCKLGKAGDRLWVREAWSVPHRYDGHRPLHIDVIANVYYHADNNNISGLIKRPSIHMPRWASRINLEITSIRVEKLQDISDVDAIAEGIQADFLEHIHGPAGYRDLWESINGQGSWDKNPWVWVIEFKRIDVGVSA